MCAYACVVCMCKAATHDGQQRAMKRQSARRIAVVTAAAATVASSVCALEPLCSNRVRQPAILLASVYARAAAAKKKVGSN